MVIGTRPWDSAAGTRASCPVSLQAVSGYVAAQPIQTLASSTTMPVRWLSVCAPRSVTSLCFRPTAAPRAGRIGHVRGVPVIGPAEVGSKISFGMDQSGSLLVRVNGYGPSSGPVPSSESAHGAVGCFRSLTESFPAPRGHWDLRPVDRKESQRGRILRAFTSQRDRGETGSPWSTIAQCLTSIAGLHPAVATDGLGRGRLLRLV